MKMQGHLIVLTKIDQNGYSGYSYCKENQGAFAAHSSNKDLFYSKKSEKKHSEVESKKKELERMHQKKIQDKEYYENLNEKKTQYQEACVQAVWEKYKFYFRSYIEYI